MKKLQYTTNDPSATTDYLAADNTWKTIPGGGGSSGIPKGTTSGTDTYTTTISGVTAYNDGDAYLIRFSIGNTTGCTLNINSLGAKTLYRNNDGALVGGDIIDGAEMFCIYNSTLNGFQVIGTAPNTLLAYVTNVNGSTITKGQPVYAFGGQGDRLTVKLAANTADSTSAQTVGIVLSTSIANNQKGLIIVNGQLDGLNIFPTSTWADGDAVYLGATAGTVTKTKPSAPNHLVYLGFVTTANNGSAGRMYVRVQNGYEMDEIHDVKITSVANNDILKYNSSNQLWENSNALSTKQDTITGAASTVVSSNLTNGVVVVSNGGGKIASSGVFSYELGYLSGVTSNVQTQLNAKQDTLVSGTNIKTINGDSILGSGNELVFNYDRAKYGYEIFNDFIAPITGASGNSDTYTIFSSGTSAAIAAGATLAIRSQNQQGFIQFNTGSTATGVTGIYGTVGGANTNNISIGGGEIGFISSVYVPILSTSLERYRIVVGFGNSALNASDTTSIIFTYDEGGIQNGTTASPNWQCVTAVNSVRTLTVTSVPVSSTWTKLGISINASGTSVDFLIDNALVATHTTNVPNGISTTNIMISKLSIGKSIGTNSRNFFCDYFGYKQTFTTPRI